MLEKPCSRVSKYYSQIRRNGKQVAGHRQAWRSEKAMPSIMNAVNLSAFMKWRNPESGLWYESYDSFMGGDRGVYEDPITKELSWETK